MTASDMQAVIEVIMCACNAWAGGAHLSVEEVEDLIHRTVPRITLAEEAAAWRAYAVEAEKNADGLTDASRIARAARQAEADLKAFAAWAS